MTLGDRVTIPLLTQLIPGGITPGSIFTVEFDPDSQWLAVAATIAAKYVQAGGRVNYVSSTRPPEAVKENLTTLGIDVPAANKEDHLLIDDWHTATLTGGRIEPEAGKSSKLFEPIEGGMQVRSLKVADLSVEWLKWSKQGSRPREISHTWPPGSLTIIDSDSEALRFNEENPVLELVISRVFPSERKAKKIDLVGWARGIHTESFYKRIEGASDGIIDLRVMERDEAAKNLLRVRSLKGQPHDSRWHVVEIKSNGEAALIS